MSTTAPGAVTLGRVIDGMHFYLRLHALRHVPLRLSNYHSIIFGDKKPTRNVPPQRAPHRNGDTAQRYRPLHGEDGSIVGGCVLRKRSLEGCFGQPNQTIGVGRKLWRLGMRFEPIESSGARAVT
jgi:hypothetical protein